MPYNRSWSFNVGMKYSKSNIMVFGDADLIMRPDNFINGLKSLDKYDMVSPYHSVIDLTPEESNLNFNNIISIDRPGRGETDNQKINISGGISMFRKDAIQNIAGWNEMFIGWGGEDDFQTIKVKNLISWTELSAKCYHFWHQREQPDMTYYGRSIQLINQANSMTKEQLKISISNSMKNIGMKNKYN